MAEQTKEQSALTEGTPSIIVAIKSDLSHKTPFGNLSSLLITAMVLSYVGKKDAVIRLL